MENYRGTLTGVLFFFAIFGGLVAFGLSTGMLPGKTKPLKRSESPSAFYLVIILYSCIALAAIYGAIDLILRMNHHKGLW
jgi:hypothetical protein